MLRRMHESWRHFDANDGGAGGGASAGAPAGGAAAAAPSAGQPPAPQPTPPSIDPAEHARLQLANARLAARVEFPQADVELLEALTEPAQITAVARRTHELQVAAAQTQAQAQGGAPAPVPPANAAGAAEGEEARRLRELQFKVRQRMRPGYRGGRTVLEPWEAEEARDLFFKASWNGHMGHRRDGRGNVSAPPAGAPAAAAAPALPAPGRAF